MSPANSQWNPTPGTPHNARRIPTLAMDTAEACRALNVSDNTLRDMISDGIVPAVRVGRRVLIPVDALRQRLSELALSDSQSKSRRDVTSVADGMNNPATDAVEGVRDDR